MRRRDFMAGWEVRRRGRSRRGRTPEAGASMLAAFRRGLIEPPCILPETSERGT
jgi:hypothetical protein